MVRRNQVKEEKPSFSNTEIVIQLGRDWNNLTETQKLVFEKLSEADRKRYEQEITIYKRDNPHLFVEDNETKDKESNVENENEENKEETTLDIKENKVSNLSKSNTKNKKKEKTVRGQKKAKAKRAKPNKVAISVSNNI